MFHPLFVEVVLVPVCSLPVVLVLLASLAVDLDRNKLLLEGHLLHGKGPHLARIARIVCCWARTLIKLK